MSNWTNMKWVNYKLFEVALPGDMEQVPSNPKTNDCKMTKVCREDLLIKSFFGHAIMTLEIVSRGYAVPNTAGCRVLGQTLAERREFRCH